MYNYDKYYQELNYFGEPYEELKEYFACAVKGHILDVGVGQGRNALFLEESGFTVTGIDVSQVGLDQIYEKNKRIRLFKRDMYEYDYSGYDYILLDSMLHFYRKDLDKERGLVNKILDEMEVGSELIICMQFNKKRLDLLHETLDNVIYIKMYHVPQFKSDYLMMVHKKVEKR